MGYQDGFKVYFLHPNLFQFAAAAHPQIAAVA
jgi:hypothetical protein